MLADSNFRTARSQQPVLGCAPSSFREGAVTRLAGLRMTSRRSKSARISARLGYVTLSRTGAAVPAARTVATRMGSRSYGSGGSPSLCVCRVKEGFVFLEHPT